MVLPEDPGSPSRIASEEVGGEVTQSKPPPPRTKVKGKGTCKVPDYHSDDDESSNGGLESPPATPRPGGVPGFAQDVLLDYAATADRTDPVVKQPREVTPSEC